MFNKEKTSSTEKQISSSATLISAGTILTGDILSETDLRIDGTVKGNIKCSAKIIIGTTGFVDGNIEGSNADVTGKVQGHIVVKEFLQLRGQCNVTGNLSAAKLQIDPTATFNGQCQMNNGVSAATTKNNNSNVKANIVQMSTDVQPAAEAK
jgi:cytoskeletal protein CcmA (bactofilin family)